MIVKDRAQLSGSVISIEIFRWVQDMRHNRLNALPWGVLLPRKASLRVALREDIKTKKTFQFGHCPNYPNPPRPPIRATLPTFSGRQKQRFARMAEKILMMIIIVAVIILIKILVLLMIIMTKNTEKPTNIVNFG